VWNQGDGFSPALRFAAEAQKLKERFAALPSREAGRTTFVDLSLGRQNHVESA